MCLQIASINLLLDSLSIKAFHATCKVEICKVSSNNFIVVSCAANWFFMKFGRSVLRPNTSYDELNPLLLINALLVHTTQATAVS